MILLQDDYDTSESDGSGTIHVTANEAHATNKYVFFYGVVVETTGDYATWSKDNIRHEAINMLERDYTSPMICTETY